MKPNHPPSKLDTSWIPTGYRPKTRIPKHLISLRGKGAMATSPGAPAGKLPTILVGYIPSRSADAGQMHGHQPLHLYPEISDLNPTTKGKSPPPRRSGEVYGERMVAGWGCLWGAWGVRGGWAVRGVGRVRGGLGCSWREPPKSAGAEVYSRPGLRFSPVLQKTAQTR
jgi:hypothetical protein